MHRFIELEAAARDFMDHEDYENAIKTYQVLLSECPNWEKGLGHYELGLCYEYLGDWDQAVSFYKQAVDLRPHDPMFWLTYAYASAEHGDAQDALIYYCALFDYRDSAVLNSLTTDTKGKLHSIKSRLGWSDSQLRHYLLENVKEMEVSKMVVDSIF